MKTENRNCPTCGQKGKAVKAITLKSLLTSDKNTTISERDNNFCTNAECNTVYYNLPANQIYSKSDLTVRVGLKETGSPRPICYCFDHSMEEIDEQVKRTGESTVAKEVSIALKDGCWCKEKNPQGSCCLGSINAYTKEAQATFGAQAVNSVSTVKQIKSAAPIKKETLFGVGALITAIAVSSCCWLPLVLVMFGFSGFAISSLFEEYRILFMSLTFGLLGFAFYFTYRPAKKGVPMGANGEACDTEEDCCEPEVSNNNTKSRRFNVKKLNKIMLWGITGLTAAFFFFPNYVGILVGADKTASDSGQIIACSIDGMTCTGCEAGVNKALLSVPGVASATSDHKAGTASITVKEDATVDKEALKEAIKKAGFTLAMQDNPKVCVLGVDGMTCGGCAAGVKSALEEIEGVDKAEVSFKDKKAVVSLASGDVSQDVLKKAVEKAGFTVKSIEVK